MTAPAPTGPGYEAAIGIADAYLYCRTVLADLETTWAGLRDPFRPWPQTAMRLADQHVVLRSAAAVVRRVLADAARADRQPGFEVGLRERAGDLGALVTTTPEGTRYLLAADVEHYLRRDGSTVWRVRDAVDGLIDSRRAYMRDALAACPVGQGG